MIEPEKPLKKKHQIKFDEEVSLKLQAEEQEELTIEEKSTLFAQLLEKRKKHFAAKREEEQTTNKGSTKKDHEMFDKAFKRVNTFEDFREELVEGSNKRAGAELEQETLKKQKVDNEQETTDQKVNDEQETTRLNECLEVVPEEIGIDAIPLAFKSLIVDWKIRREEKKSYY
ncbi:hypothetical protein Tco_1537480, partial [Tanacetum coccineum]